MVGYRYHKGLRLQFLAMTVGLSIIVRPTTARVLFLIPVSLGVLSLGKRISTHHSAGIFFNTRVTEESFPSHLIRLPPLCGYLF